MFVCTGGLLVSEQCQAFAMVWAAGVCIGACEHRMHLVLGSTAAIHRNSPSGTDIQYVYSMPMPLSSRCSAACDAPGFIGHGAQAAHWAPARSGSKWQQQQQQQDAAQWVQVEGCADGAALHAFWHSLCQSCWVT